jgi:hypothetical protein
MSYLKNFSKKFEKPLDKPPQVCYNKSVNKRGALDRQG